MIKNTTLYFDMDGVLDNFKKAATELGIKFNGYQFADEASAWDKIHSKGYKFWSELEWIDGSCELFSYACQMFQKVEVLSAKSTDESCVVGKMIWCRQLKKIASYYGTKFKVNLVLNHEKVNYAISADGTKNILIDDYEENIKNWEGYGILFENAKQAKIELLKLSENLCHRIP